MPTEHGKLFIKVAECLYRHKSSEIYYGLVKRSGKQFRRSLKTNDRKLAERKLANFRVKVSRLTLTNRSQNHSIISCIGKVAITFARSKHSFGNKPCDSDL
jgi:hypothetical protein